MHILLNDILEKKNIRFNIIICFITIDDIFIREIISTQIYFKYKITISDNETIPISYLPQGMQS